MVGHDLPDPLEIHVEVGVRGDVAKAVDRPPRNVGVAVLELGTELTSRIGEDLEPPPNSVLDLAVLEERRTAPTTYSPISAMLSAMCSR